MSGKSDEIDQIRDYDELYKNFKWEVPEYYNFGFDVVDRWGEDRTKLALISIDRTGKHDRYHTFFDLSKASDKFSVVLQNIGLKKGDRVLVILQSIPEWYISIIGMFKLGVIPMPGTVLLTSKDIEFRINRAEATMVLTDLDHADSVEAVKAKCPTLKQMMLVDGKRTGWYNYDEEMNDVTSTFEIDKIEKTII